MKVKVIKRFNDVSAKPKKIRNVDDILDVTKERAEHLVKQGMVVIVKEKKTAKAAE